MYLEKIDLPDSILEPRIFGVQQQQRDSNTERIEFL